MTAALYDDGYCYQSVNVMNKAKHGDPNLNSVGLTTLTVGSTPPGWEAQTKTTKTFMTI